MTTALNQIENITSVPDVLFLDHFTNFLIKGKAYSDQNHHR